MVNFVQNAYTFYSSTIGQAGQVSDVSLRNVESFAAEDIIQFGVPVKRGTDKAGQVLPWLENDLNSPVVGIALYERSKAPTQNNILGNRYEIGDTVSVLTFGKVLVVAHVDVVAGDKAYVITAADETAGKFTNVAGDNQLVGTFKSTVTAGNLVELEIK